MTAWIGLGGNRDDSAELIGQALERIAANAAVTLRRRSAIYRSPPWGVTDQPDFFNAVAELETTLAPLELLRLLLETETDLGRRRTGVRWGPRCIDLDLLTYEQLELHTEALELPHPRMHQRAFVLLPLLELEPGFVIPGRGLAADWLERIDGDDVAAVQPLSSRHSEQE